MKRIMVAFGFLVLAVPAFAQRLVDKDGRVIQVFPYKDHPAILDAPAARNNNLTNHGGPTITQAHVVEIFWGPSWGNGQTPGAVASELMAFYSQFGTTPEYKTIVQYSGIQQNNLTNVYWIDGVNPSNVAVTDAMIQTEVKNYINQHGGAIDDSAVYEVFLPVGYYSTLGSATSCGGPHLQYCAYHSNFSFSGHDVKYSSMPQPSCSGCQWTGWTTAQNFEHFGTHETREAVTDPDGNAWFDRQGNEADDKCAWSPAPFIGTGGFGYQLEWSNADHGCVKTK